MFFSRYWSLVVAILFPLFAIATESAARLGEYDVVLQAILSVICLALFVHSWFMQRRYTQNKWRLSFFTLLLIFFALVPLWLGLNVIRNYSYNAGVEQMYSLYSDVVILQDAIVWLAKTLCVVVSLWMIVDSGRWLVKRIRA